MEEGKTGRVSFNEAGDRLGCIYDVVNVRKDKSLHKIGTFKANDPVSWGSL